MTMVFAPLDSHYEERAALHRSARLSMLRDRVVKRMAKVNHLADEVERAAAEFVGAAQGSAIEAFCGAVKDRQARLRIGNTATGAS
ncbi:hypothetical protein A9K66_27995 [Mesorhizobium sp. AA23]|nr:hypothetical protein A9K66_27995 [Mesorhizobium sp. AA23]